MPKIKSDHNAFVLHYRPFKENQLLVDLLTETEGKISALVFVGQSNRSIKKGLIQPFVPLICSFKDNNTTLKQIVSVETSAQSYALTKDYLFSGFYLNELLFRLLNNDIACEDLFKHYQSTLCSLSKCLPIAAQLRNFELSLLSELGLSLDFSPVLNEVNDKVVGYYYEAEQGFVPAYDYSVNSISTPWFQTQHLQTIAHYIDRDKVLNNKAVEHTFKLLMRSIFNHLLDGKPLNSRKLFAKK